MEQEIVYECLHCGKKNPEYLAYRNEGNCCAKCLKDLDYYVVYDDEESFVIKLTNLLTKKSAEKWIDYDNTDKKKYYRNIRVITTKEYEHLKLIKDIYYYKKEILSTKQTLARLKTQLKIKEEMLNGGKK